MNVDQTSTPHFLKGTAVFSLIVLAVFGALAISGAIGAFVLTARDGYRAVPTRRA